MPTVQNIRWFKQQFAEKIEAAVLDSPFTLDMLTAIACQETGEIWGSLRKQGLPTEQILKLCVGDVIYETGGRKAFPRNKQELLARAQGDKIYEIARKALIDMAEYITPYKPYISNPERFCHGFGIFQYDFQFFKTDPDYFLNKGYENLELCLGKCLAELNVKLKRLGWADKTSLTDLEMAAVAIAYNTGGYKPQLGLKQGHKSGNKYYGEFFYEYLQLSKAVSVQAGVAELSASGTGSSVINQTWHHDARGPLYHVEVQMNPLRLRKEPVVDEVTDNVLARLTDGQLVKAINDVPVNGFLEVETHISSGNIRGYASVDYLKKV